MSDFNNLRSYNSEETSKDTLNLKKQTTPAEKYTEKYRPQYHVTPEYGRLNDPNGMVYYEGKYHLYYQYVPDSKTDKIEKHWAHVVSSDMVNWEERPIALFPDMYGSMWSGSAIVDENNTSGLFTDTPEKKGLVALYTVTDLQSVHQRQSLAYSTDGGETWIKYNNGAPVLDNAADPLNAPRDFRDPKIFWHDESEQWMMVIAGGPLRFYSSDNLIDWKAEGMQNEIYSECPDLYKFYLDDNPENAKWVLSLSGVTYMIGDFRKVNGVWRFVPDTSERFRFNYAPDVYAAQSFANVPGGRIINMNWMTYLGHADPDITDPWNGAMTLPYELKLKTINNRPTLIQTPVPELEVLRGEEFSFNNLTVTPETINPLKNIQADLYEINATIDIGTAQQFGLKLRAGSNYFTDINYNTNTKHLTLDRSRSGASAGGGFLSAYRTVAEPVNGKIKLQIYVDNSSIEMFAQDGAYLYTALIFPDTESVGLEIYSKGGNITVDNMTIHRLNSIYPNQKPPSPATSIKTVTSNNSVRIGDVFTVWAAPTPFNAANANATWDVADSTVFEIVEQGSNNIILKALKLGSSDVTATVSGQNNTLQISVDEDSFNTNLNLDNYTVLNGSWGITPEGFEGTSGGNGPVFFSNTAANFTYETDFTFKNGIVAGALLFRATDDFSTFYSADLNEDTATARILRFTRNPQTGHTTDITLGNPFTFTTNPSRSYKLKIVTEGVNIKYYIDDVLAVDVNNSVSLSGKFGFNVCDATGVFQNAFYSIPTFSIAYDANGAESGSTPTDNETYQFGSNIPILGNTGNLQRANHTFAGWTLNSNGTGQVYNSGDSILMGNANIVLYAKWNEEIIANTQYTITFNHNYIGAPTPLTRQTNPNGNGRLTGFPTVTRTGWRFTGWFTTAATGGIQRNLNHEYTEDTTLFARWTRQTHTVTFRGGKNFTKTITHGNKINLTSAERKRAGFTYIGVFTDSKMTKKWGNANITSARTLYIKWERNPTKPTNVRVAKSGTKKAKITWKKQAGVVFEIQMRRNNGKWTSAGKSKAGAGVFTTRNLQKGRYAFRVRATKKNTSPRNSGYTNAVRQITINR